MAGLLGLLDLGAGAITAQNAGVAVAGRNTANVNTEGYSRESINLASQPGVPLVGGVTSGAATRAADDMLSTRERQADGDHGRSDALSGALSSMEKAATPPAESLVQAFASLFGSIGQLAASPTDAALRQQVVSGAASIADSFARMSAAIAASQADADARISAIAKEASQLASQLAHLNNAMTTSPDPVLADQRDLAARQLTALTGGQARIDPDGMMRFVLGDGQSLVDGTHAASLQTTPDAKYANHLRIDVADGVHVTDVTTALDGGQLAGQIAARDGSAAQAAASIDQLAFDTATRINAVHAAGAGLDGVNGRNLFAVPALVAGAAASMAVDPAVAANPSLVAAAAAGAAAGDNRNALALGALGDQLLAGGGTRTLSDQAIQIAGTIGSAAKTAADQQSLDAARLDVLKSARDSLSGVSTQEELAKLAQFQHASQAAAQFVVTVNDLLTNLIQKL